MMKKTVLALVLCLWMALMPVSGGIAASEICSFTMQPISWDGVAIGKLALPFGFFALSEVHCGDESTCLGSPLRISLTAMSEDGQVNMSYNANETYVDRVSTAYSILAAGEGELDSQTAIFQREYCNAAQYCDAMAQQMNATFYKEEPIALYDAMVDKHYREYAGTPLPAFMEMQWCEVTAAQRVYTYTLGDKTWALCIATEVRGLQYRLANAPKEVLTVWDLPNGVFQLICPLEDYERIHDGAFAAFLQNTSATDTFFALQEELSATIRDSVIGQMNRVTAQSMAYAAAMDTLRSQSVNAYLASSSYDTAARFSDYLFDTNTYVTSDGGEVSVSTDYGYVWEGENGTIYCSQLASDLPYGVAQLSPR